MTIGVTTMTISAALRRIYELPPAERQAAFDAAAQRAMDAAHEASVAHKARKPDPYANEYLYWKKERLACVLVVRHCDKPASYEISRDGGGYHHLYLPFSRTRKLSESNDDFLMALIPRRWVEMIEKREFESGQRLRELFGITLPLSAARPWTEAQCETWKQLSNRRMSINSRIASARPRSVSNISRTNAA